MIGVESSSLQNRSPGHIIEADIKGFEGLAAQGDLHVEFMNTGSVSADYTVTDSFLVLQHAIDHLIYRSLFPSVATRSSQFRQKQGP